MCQNRGSSSLYQQLPHQTSSPGGARPSHFQLLREDHVQTVSNPGQSFYTVQPCPSLQTWRGLFGCDGGGEGLLVSTPLGSGVPSSPPDGGVA